MPGSPQAGGWNLDPGASVCPAPPRSLLPLEARGVVSRGGAGKGGCCCACELERPSFPGGRLTVLARNWEGGPDPAALLPPHSSAVRDRRASREVGCLVRHWP